MLGISTRVSVRALAIIALLAAPPLLWAQSAYEFDIPAQALDTALRTIGQKTSTNILFEPAMVKGLKAPALRAQLTADEAIRQLLDGTKLQGQRTSSDTIVVRNNKADSNPKTADAESTLEETRVAQTDNAATPADAGAQAAHGAKADLSERNEISEIIVTAQKRRQNLQDTAMSIAALSGEDIQRQSLVGMSDYLNQTPGVTLLEWGVGQNQIVMRGIGAGFGEDSAVGVYFGEMPLQGIAGSSIVDLKLVDMERVEVLRGPQGTLYGSGSMGGAIRNIPAAPNLTQREGRLEAGYSNTAGTGGNNINLSGVINVPLLEDRLALRVVAYRYDNSGYIDNIAAADPATIAMAAAYGSTIVNEDEIGGSDYTGARASLLWKPTEQLDATLIYGYQKLEQDGFTSVDLAQGGYRDTILSLRNLTRDGHEATADQIQFANLVMEYDLGWGSLLSASSGYDGSGGWDYDVSRSLPFPIGQLRDDTKKGFTQEVRFASQLEGALQFLAGLYYEDRKQTLASTAPWLGDPALMPAFFGTDLDDLYNDDSRWRVKQKAVFGELSYAWTERFKLTAGGRWFDYARDDFTSITGALTGGGTFLDDTAKESGASFKVNAAYTPNDDVLLYAQWAQGFRLGKAVIPVPAALCDQNPNDGFLDGTSVPIASDSVDSDTLDSYELGGKFGVGNRLIVNAALYRIDWKGIPVGVVATPNCGFTVVVNAGEARSQGVELETNYQLTNALRVDLGAAYIDAELSKDDPALGPKGTRLPTSAEFTANIGLQYEFKVSGHDSFLRANYAYTGDVLNDIRASLPKAQAAGKVNVRAGIALNNIEVELYAVNLTNSDAIAFVDANVAFRTRPRTVGLDLSYRF